MHRRAIPVITGCALLALGLGVAGCGSDSSSKSTSKGGDTMMRDAKPKPKASDSMQPKSKDSMQGTTTSTDAMSK
jgi:hypothetical protein